MMSTKCDKCGRVVPPHNDAVNLDMERPPHIVGDWVMYSDSRHLLPIIEDGKVVCPGSPSRAQYLPGQPRDTRVEHAYDPKREEGIRMAYARLLEKYPAPEVSA